jgi:hypothetical protein
MLEEGYIHYMEGKNNKQEERKGRLCLVTLS